VVVRVECEGAPRDLGLDQGRACRDALRADARAAGAAARGRGFGDSAFARLRAALRDPASAGPLARDLSRHFPHLDERSAGLAAASGLARAALLDLLARELEDAPAPRVGIRAGERGPIVALELAAPLPPTGLVARSARPDGGFANVGVTRPGLAASLAAVNERGLAGAVAWIAAPAPDERCRAPGALLVEGCIERLDAVEKALEWCERRPGGGRALLVFADAGGACGAIEVDGEKRRRVAPPRAAQGPGAGARVSLDPAARALELALPGAEPLRLEVPSTGSRSVSVASGAPQGGGSRSGSR
jgi:hypothetical protein